MISYMFTAYLMCAGKPTTLMGMGYGSSEEAVKAAYVHAKTLHCSVRAVTTDDYTSSETVKNETLPNSCTSTTCPLKGQFHGPYDPTASTIP